MNTISILLPTRQRTKILHPATLTLLENASGNNKIEICFGIDDDDTETSEYINNTLSGEIAAYPFAVGRKFTFKRMGYLELNKYLNYMAVKATGNWILFWNDDAQMQTKAWDEEIVKFNGKFRLLRAKYGNHVHPFALFPIVPKLWVEMTGYLSPHYLTDNYLTNVFSKANSMVDIPISILHDRHDLTGNNNDEIYQSREFRESGDVTDVKDVYHPNNLANMQRDTDLIKSIVAQEIHV